MTMLTPQPRYRIYTNATRYWHVFTEFLTGRHNKGSGIEELVVAMQDLFQTSYVLPMPTARFAIYLAIKNIIKTKRKIILSPYTIVDVINMVICAGAIPVFADIDPITCNIDANEIEKLIDEETGLVLITHLHGLACDLNKIKKICEDKQICLIEDCAQAFNMRYESQHGGTFGDVGIFSFGMYKTINSFYGGLLITKNSILFEKIKEEIEQLSFFPISMYLKKYFFALATDILTAPGIFQTSTYWIFRQAYLKNIASINNIVKVDKNPSLKTVLPKKYQYRMLPLQARLIIKQLDDLEKNYQKRLERAQLYFEGLHDIPEILLPPMLTDQSHLYTYYPIQVPNREEIIRHGHIEKRDWMLCHYHNLADVSCFKSYKRDCPNARSVARSLIYLPTYPRYSLNEVRKNIKALRKIFLKS